MRNAARIGVALLVLFACVIGAVVIESALANLARRTSLLFPPARGAVLAEVCGEIEEMLRMAKREWGEEQVFYAVTDTGMSIHVLVAPRGHWTELLGPVGGPVCIVKQGAAWGSRLTRAQ